MRVDINKVNDKAQEAVGYQMTDDASEMGDNIEERIQRLMDQINSFSEELNDIVSQVGDNTSYLLGNEENMLKISDSLANDKAKINSLIDVKEMDLVQQMSEMMTMVTAMQNRTIGSQIKDEAKAYVNNIVEKSREAISCLAEKATSFFKSVRASVNKAIDSFKETASNTIEAVSTYRNTLKMNKSAEMDSQSPGLRSSDREHQLKEVGERNPNNRISYLLADRTKELEDLKDRYQNSVGIDKLLYKTAIEKTEATIDVLNHNDERQQKRFDLDKNVLARYEAMEASQQAIQEKLIETKDIISYTVSSTIQEIKDAATAVRDKTLTAAIDKLEAATNKAKSYAESKGIDLATPDKAKEESKDQDVEIEMEND